MRIQRRLKISRARLSNYVHQAVRREVELTAKRFGVSKSFVQATALADFFGIDIEERYDEPRLKVVKGRNANLSNSIHRRPSRARVSATHRRVS